MLSHLHPADEWNSQEIQNKLLTYEKGNRIHHTILDQLR